MSKQDQAFCVTHRYRGNGKIEASILHGTFMSIMTYMTIDMVDYEALSIIPVEPRDYAWIELRGGDHYFVSTNSYGRFCRITVTDCQEAARLLDSRRFGAMLIANALAGERDQAWAFLHAGFTPEALKVLAQRLFDSCKPAALVAAEALRRYADDRTLLCFDAERALNRLPSKLSEALGYAGRVEDRADVRHVASDDASLVGRIEADHVQTHYIVKYDPVMLSAMADKWATWANTGAFQSDGPKVQADNADAS